MGSNRSWSRLLFTLGGLSRIRYDDLGVTMYGSKPIDIERDATRSRMRVAAGWAARFATRAALSFLQTTIGGCCDEE